MSKIVEQIKSAKVDIESSKNFVDEVMAKIEAPAKQKINWLIAVPAFGILLIAFVSIVAIGNDDSTATSKVENDIIVIEDLLAELSSSFSDEELADVE